MSRQQLHGQRQSVLLQGVMQCKRVPQRQGQAARLDPGIGIHCGIQCLLHGGPALGKLSIARKQVLECCRRSCLAHAHGCARRPTPLSRGDRVKVRVPAQRLREWMAGCSSCQGSQLLGPPVQFDQGDVAFCDMQRSVDDLMFEADERGNARARSGIGKPQRKRKLRLGCRPFVDMTGKGISNHVLTPGAGRLAGPPRRWRWRRHPNCSDRHR